MQVIRDLILYQTTQFGMDLNSFFFLEKKYILGLLNQIRNILDHPCSQACRLQPAAPLIYKCVVFSNSPLQHMYLLGELVLLIF